ncbi:MAG: hypothetical protein V4549_10000 [Bacteroidota bacterium]
MKLFCHCNICKKKVQLASSSSTRQEFSNNWGQNFNINCPHCQSQTQININMVKAESSFKNGIGIGGVIGGILGAFAGPAGMFLGVGLGASVGGGARLTNKNAVDVFNNSYIK